MFKSLVLKLHLKSSKRSSDIPYLFLITDSIRLSKPKEILKYLKKDMGIIYRNNQKKDALSKTKKFLKKCKERKVKFFFAGSICQASSLRITNIHIPENLLRMPTKAGLHLRRINKKLLVTASAHSYPAIVRASQLGVSAILLSPVFKTESNFRKNNLGIIRFSMLTNKSSSPIVALGGVNKQNVKKLYFTNASGVAALNAFKNINVNN